MSNDLSIIFFGTPDFAATILERLIQSDYKPSLVVTAPDKPVGRKQILTPPTVKTLALEHNIEILQPEKLDSSISYKLKAKSYQLSIVVAYGQIIPQEILHIPQHGTLNVHPSLLPRWRGPSPIQSAILNGDEKTGVTIMLLDEVVDHGPILRDFRFQISDFSFTTGMLSQKLAELGAELLVKTIPKWVSGAITPIEQDHSKATYSKKITKQDGRIDWSKSAQEIESQMRAFDPWPGIFTLWNNKRIKILKAHIAKNPDHITGDAVGKVVLTESGTIGITTKDELFIIDTLQLDGKKEMRANEFLNGYSHFVGSTLK